jgi:uncharacterized protein (AIM24 family)
MAYTCPWCNHVSAGTALSCPACGAPVDVRQVTSPSGWSELPGIRDMARLEMGRSTCQIEGTYVPVADVALQEGDGVYFTHHVLLWKEPTVRVTALPLKGGWKRLFAGLPLIMTEARGHGHIAFSQDRAGELIALPLEPGQSVDVREHVLVMATSSVAYDWFSTNIWYSTRPDKDVETHYPLGRFMDRFRAGTDPGLVILHGSGNVFVRRLEAGEAIDVKAAALLYKDSTARVGLYIEEPASGGGGYQFFVTGSRYTQRYTWIRVVGPGRVAIQSADKHQHEPGGPLVAACPPELY